MKRKPRTTRTAALPEPTVVLDGYQVEATRWLLQHPFAAVLLDPGLGKTVVLLMAFWLLKRAGLVDFLVVVAPMRACHLVWPAEVEKWSFPFKVAILHGPGKDSAVSEDADVYCVNYEGLGWLHPHIEGLRRRRGRGWLVADESTKVKHVSSLRHRMIMTMVECFGRRTNLTGTPIPNGYLDIFGQQRVLDLGRTFGEYVTHFQTKYFQPLFRDDTLVTRGAKTREDRDLAVKMAKKSHKIARWVPTKKGRAAIDEALKDYCIRFSDKELGLKAIRYNVIKVELPPKARRQYEDLERDFTIRFEDDGYVLTPNAGALGIKLRQVANGSILDAERRVHRLHDAKAVALVELVEELGGKQLLIGYEFNADRDLALEYLKKAGYDDVPVVKGGMKFEDSLANIRRFDATGCQLLLCQYGTVAHALNLQKNCHNVAAFGMIWDLEIYIQFLKRVHRKGQRKLVGVHEFVAADTRDVVVSAARRGKDRTQSRFLKLMEDFRKRGFT